MSKKSNGAEKARKIILFLSDLKKGAEEQTYACPDGSKVVGTQTNEAPVKYLLKAYRDVCEVLCIVTPVAEKSGAFEKLKTAIDKVTVKDITFDGRDFAAGPLAEIMSRMKKGDEILLDTTGGLRDAIMQLLLVSRALSFSGIPTVGAVYANYGAKQIVDCSHLIGLFDLVGGMQEMASFGSVKTLRDYYNKEKAKQEVTDLLNAMEELQENITLCRTGKLDACIKKFNEAMEGAESCEDPLVKALLPAFQDKFDKKLNIPGLIHWCINSDMLQQALTIYRERIPAYILRDRVDLVKLKEDMGEKAKELIDDRLKEKKEYETEEEVKFRLLLDMGRRMKYRYYDNESQSWTVDPAVVTLKHLEQLAESSDHFKIVCTMEQMKDIIMDYQYIRMLRNMINHANEQSTQNQQQLIKYLAGFGYKPLDEVGAEDIRAALERGLENLKKR